MLLNWKRIFENEKKDGKTALIGVYMKNKDEFIIKGTMEDKLKKLAIEHLTIINSKGKDGENMILPLKDNKYNFLALLAAEDKNDIKDNIFENSAKLHGELEKYGIKNVEIVKDFHRETIAHGLVIKGFTFDFLKKEKKESIYIEENNDDKFKIEMDKFKAQNYGIFLQEIPANFLTPTLFTKYAQEYLEDKENIKINIYNEEYMKEKGMNMLLSVGQGSEQPSKLLVIEYKGKKEEGYDLGLVGKGVTFDSGGISLKPSGNMKSMKKDMGGASVVLSAIGHIAKYKEKINIVVVIPLVENLPSGKATKPGDVFIAMNGKTVDVTNTDAEGRLILGDALYFTQKEYQPKYLLDFATLTGAIIVSLGNVYSGVFSNDENLYKMIEEASVISQDPVWQMPLDKHAKKRLKGDVSDLLNHKMEGGGGSIFAAVFLEEFIEENVKWAHFDIAGMMEAPHLRSVYGDYSQGKPIILLLELVKAFASKN